MSKIKTTEEEILKFANHSYRFKSGSKKISEQVNFPKNLYAIQHKKNILEFIFSPTEKTEPYLNREFNFIYSGEKYRAYFAKPTDFFKNVFIKRYLEPQDKEDLLFEEFSIMLQKYKDFYSLNNAPKNTTSYNRLQAYFANKMPVNFFIEGKFKKDFNFTEFASNLNFFMRFYDRETPFIFLYEEEENTKLKFNTPCHLNKNSFPSNIDCKKINQVLLDIFNITATTPSIRLRYIFYFQILEYASYYFIKEDTKKRISKILNDPNINQKIGNVAKLIIEESREYVNRSDDNKRLEQTISSLCEYKCIQNEIEQNLEYFKKETIFDGGFSIPPLLNDKQDISNPSPQIMVNIKNNIEKIRNVLVHLKESRENNVILPTKNNNHLLKPYLYLIRRIAEQVAIQFDNL